MKDRIVFMGTPEFASTSLLALVKGGVDVAAVVTAPDRPAGRGLKLKASAVKEQALALGIPVLQPEKLRDPEFLSALDDTGASLYVVVAFRMLPEVVWSRPKYGTINLHASLLPDYRGAAPINWAVINGEQRTGITTFFIRQQIDTGDIIAQEELAIGPDEMAGELHDRMMHAGGALITRTALDIFQGKAARLPQEQLVHSPLHEAPKLNAVTCRIDWSRDMAHVHDHIRGLSPFPGAWSQLIIDDLPPQHFKVLRSRVAYRSADGGPGT
ncbi:MAG: methionyl-tRNA formyltransferase, partial [Flavobacteriales bacterium]|nr:methionyl-tRNA formyltransferase [Flavobacteriales bacterium]